MRYDGERRAGHAQQDSDSLSPANERTPSERTPGKRTLMGELRRRQAKGAPTAAAVDPGPATSGGISLPDGVRSKMERSFGADFSDVRVHHDARAANLGVRALADGTDIHFGAGEYDPGSERGQQIIGHELAHVVQQRAGRVAQPQGKGGLTTDLALEHEADELGTRAARGEVVASAGAGAVTTRAVQGYIESPTGVGLSDDVHMMLFGPKELYATEALINESNTALAAAAGGAAAGGGAFLRLRKAEPLSDMFRVTPTVAERKTQHPNSTLPRKTFLDQKGEDGAYLSPADCHIAAMTVMGSDENPLGSYGTEQVILEDGAPLAPVASAEHPGAHVANRGKAAFFQHAMPEFARQLRSRAPSPENPARAAYTALADMIEAVPKTQAKEPGTTSPFARIYRQAIAHTPPFDALFARLFGVNRDAEPQVGDALSHINDEAEKLVAERPGRDEKGAAVGEGAARDIWNFHWAGVIMRDGADYVTLENLSTENINDLNDAWYFKMYGPEKPFHEVASKDPHSTESPLTLVFRATGQPPRQGGPNNKVLPLEEKAARAIAAAASFADLQDSGQVARAQDIAVKFGILAKGQPLTADNFVDVRKRLVAEARRRGIALEPDARDEKGPPPPPT